MLASAPDCKKSPRPPSSPSLRPVQKHLCRTLLLFAAFLLIVAPSASAAKHPARVACWKLLLNEWYGGAITTIYPLHCYTQAIDHLPADISEYSSAKQDIQAAELAAAHHKSAPPERTKPPTTGTGDANPPKKKGGFIGLLHDITPGNPQSFPLPLLVLGALAILLVIAGGVGMVWQRTHPADRPFELNQGLLALNRGPSAADEDSSEPDGDSFEPDGEPSGPDGEPSGPDGESSGPDEESSGPDEEPSDSDQEPPEPDQEPPESDQGPSEPDQGPSGL